MKRAISLAIAFLSASSVLHAQNIVGVWQGTLPPVAPPQAQNMDSGLRVTFTVDKKPDGPFRGAMSFIDRGGPMPLAVVTLSAPDVTFALSDEAMFRGKLSADGTSIDGRWTQGPQTVPLILSLATAETLWKREGPAPLAPMAANADPSYEVSTIKPGKPDEQHSLYNLQARDFNGTGITATELIKVAYNVRGRQVMGGPAWLNQTRYDIFAKPDTPGQPSVEQTRAMVHKLLIERFHLVSHTSQQDYPVLALTLDPKAPRPEVSDPKLSPNSGISSHRDGDDLVLRFTATTIHDLVGFIMNTFQDKQIVDETGLTGTYDVTFRLVGIAEGPAKRDDEIGAALVQAAQHAGFKLTSKKGQLPIVVVDHIDPPTPN